MNVSLTPLQDRDLETIYQQVTDPESVRMAAFTAEDQTDRRACHFGMRCTPAARASFMLAGRPDAFPRKLNILETAPYPRRVTAPSVRRRSGVIRKTGAGEQRGPVRLTCD